MKHVKHLFRWTGLALMAVSSVALSHGGRLNKEGCHNDHRNGTYHCHRGPSAASSTAAPTRPASPSSSKASQVPRVYFPSTTPAPTPRPAARPASSRPVQVPQIYYPSSGSVAAQAPSVQESRGAQFYFSSCDQARSIGKTVLRTVEEGYRPELDGNRNGIACEPADAL